MIKPNRLVLFGFGGAVLLQLGILLAFQGTLQSFLTHSRIIRVKVVPVDPRDIFRGDYVTLRYAFSRIARREVEDNLNTRLPRAAKIYVKLKPVGKEAALVSAAPDWRAVAVADLPFGHINPDEVMLSGHVISASENTLEVVYGCEGYYVPEGQGRSIEANIAKITVTLSITAGGRVQPVKLFMNGQEITFKR